MCWIIRNFEYYYVMGLAEMKESKTQLQDRVDKGFTRLNVFILGVLVLDVQEKRDRIMYLCGDFQ